MRTFIVGFFVTAVAASSAWAGNDGAANTPAMPIGTVAGTAAREVGQVVSVVQIGDPRELAVASDEEQQRAANAERCRPASERDPSLIPLAP